MAKIRDAVYENGAFKPLQHAFSFFLC
ncbi:MAG: DUF104 domain-containing protein [Nitrospira sp.]|nr:DUF104 domain-containing protein [Nitrospira sp.]